MSGLLTTYLASLTDADLARAVSREPTFAPTAQVAAPPAPSPSLPTPVAPLVVSTPEAWRAEWSASPALQVEFASADDYVALRKAEATGRVKAPIARSSADASGAWRAEFFASADLQAEFASVDDYLALRRAEAAGRVNLHHR